MKCKFPKVLIIGHSFDQTSGAGVTLSNLFQYWPSEHLAVAVFGRDKSQQKKSEKIIKTYLLGDKEIDIRIPYIHKLLGVNKSSEWDAITPKNSSEASKRKNNYFYSLLKTLQRKLGLEHILYNYKISDDFSKWILGYEPEIIYSALGSYPLVNFMINLKKVYNIRMVVHIWDDWPSFIFDQSVIGRMIKPRFRIKFNELLQLSDVKLSISDHMSQEYLSRYGYKFVPFHNPINNESWNDSLDNDSILDCIIYVGKINEDNLQSLLLLSKAIEKLVVDRDYSLKFRIYSPNYLQYVRRFSKYRNTELFQSIKHQEIPRILKSAKILYLPLNIQRATIKYARLSMPTKMTEYLASARPIIVVAHHEMALNDFVRSNNCALLLEKYDLMELNFLVKKVLNDDYDTEMTFNARNLVLNKFDSKLVCEKFRKVMLGNLDED